MCYIFYLSAFYFWADTCRIPNFIDMSFFNDICEKPFSISISFILFI